jgi:Fe-S cluster biogenesis protein NfuA
MNTTLDKIPDLTTRIEAALDAIRPYLEADGGNVRVLELNEEQTLRLEFVGACSSCPMSTMTFKAGVEEAIKRAVPEVKRIEVVNLTSL